MAKVLGAMRAAVLLCIVWAALLLVAHLAGVLPDFPSCHADHAESPVAPDAGSETPEDAGVPSEVPTARPDAGGLSDPEGPPPMLRSARRLRICEGASSEPTLSRLELLEGRPQLLVGCGRESVILAVRASREKGVLEAERVATLRLEAENLRGEPGGAVAEVGDVTGDGRTDLVIGHLAAATRNNAQDGALHLVARDERGGLAEPVRLAPIAVASLVVEPLAEPSVSNIVALHQADRFGRRPSEAWVFAGGGTPSRTARLDAGATGRVLQAVDLDRDGHIDVAIFSEGAPGGRVHFGDGSGGFPRSQALVLAGVREAWVVDVNGDGNPDLLTGGDALRLVRSRADATLEAEAIEAPEGVSQLRLVEPAGDGPALVGLSGEGVIILRLKDTLRFEATPLVDVPLAAGTIASLEVIGIGESGEIDLALLLRAPGEDATFDLVLFHALDEHVLATIDENPSEPDEAPLTLQITLR